MTVVVVDNAAITDVTRSLHQISRSATGTVELVLASRRSPSLPPLLARRVRRLKAATPELLDELVSREALRSAVVVVTTSSTSFATGWQAEVEERVKLHPRLISAIDSPTGGLLLYPEGVVSAETPSAPWLTAAAIRVRTSRAALAGHQSLSAVMIVKNEEDVLGECLQALAPFVDEIVVYDTGSTDATLDIARAYGAVVVEGYWNDHFGDARNRSLAHATGDWAFQIDADEVVTGNVAELRALLDHDPADQILVPIVSSAWQGSTEGLETHPVRLFRREGSAWKGALHEYPAPVNGRPPVISKTPAPLKLLHSGYELAKVQARSKTARNVDLSRRELEEAGTGADRSELLSNLARSLMWDGRVDEALEVFAELRATPGNPTAVVMSGRGAVNLLFQLNRLDEADAWIETLERHRESAGNLAVLRARRHLVAGDAEAALAAIEGLDRKGGGTDPWGIPFDTSALMALQAEVALFRGRADVAVATLVELMASSSSAVSLDLLMRAAQAAGHPMVEIAAAAPEEVLARSLREVSLYHPSGALAWFEAFRAAHPTDHRPVVAGNLFAPRADWRTALTWSAHARELGLHDVCALRGLGERESAPLLDRCVSWALLAEIFGEEEAGASFEALTHDLSVVESETLVGTLAELGIDVSAPSSDTADPADTVAMPSDVSVAVMPAVAAMSDNAPAGATS